MRKVLFTYSLRAAMHPVLCRSTTYSPVNFRCSVSTDALTTISLLITTHSSTFCWRIILCLILRTTVTSARNPEEDACHRARNLCVFSHVQKGALRLMHKGCALQCVFLDVISDVTVVLGMRQSIVSIQYDTERDMAQSFVNF